MFNKKIIETLQYQVGVLERKIEILEKDIKKESECREKFRDEFWSLVSQNYDYRTKRVVKERLKYSCGRTRDEEYIATEYTFKPKRRSNPKKK